MKKIVVFYDNWCPNCTHFIQLVKKMDWLELIDAKRLRNEQDIQPFNKTINIEKSKKEMASYNEVWNYGFDSLYLIFVRLPILWVIFPILLLLKITGIGQLLYVQIAVNRKIVPIHCDEKTCKM
jgi:predicted DCC family thiol-disulfide oxidoreductase YuxK